MDEHLTRALYLGIALLLLIFAFTSFLGLYRGYEDYYTHASDSGNQDRLKTEKPAAAEPEMSGDIVVNLILEKKRNDSDALLKELYSGSTAVSDPLPDIFVDGINYADYDLSGLKTKDSIDAAYTFDSSGKLIRIDLHKR